jgi:hypothetical protein
MPRSAAGLLIHQLPLARRALFTPLYLAAFRQAVAERLMEKGADVHAKANVRVQGF